VTFLIVAKHGGEASDVLLALRTRWPDLKFVAADNARDGRRKLVDDPPDVIFLSAMLLGDNLLELIREIRKAWGTLVMVLGSGEKESDIIEALEAGADDYIPIPIRESLLVARVSAALRRVGMVSTEKAPTLTCGDLVIDPEGHEAQLNGEPLYLTPTEFRLLVHLAQNQERVVTLEGLETVVWGTSDRLYVDVLRKHVQHLRRKLQPSGGISATIRTVPRVGYILAATNGAAERR
jgi:DNA-binding response OmpR family regulator